MIRVIGPQDCAEDIPWKVLDVTSRSNTWGRELSPFLLGPVDLYGLFSSKNVENGWQYSKVYPECLNSMGEPSDAYWHWAKKGWDKKWADRYPMGKGKIPVFSLWDSEKLGYIEARKKIYIPLYFAAVKKSEAWKKLQLLYQENPDLCLFDFDGYDSKGKNWSDIVNNPKRKMGHAFVLAMMLENIKL